MAEQPRLETYVILRIARAVLVVLILGGLLFALAGTFDWPEAWIFSSGFLAYVVGMSIWCMRYDPALLRERSKPAKANVKGWDQAIVPLATLMLFFAIVVAGLDAGRFGWSSVPLPVKLLAGTGLILTAILPAWAQMVNTYHSTVVRIQEDRGQEVVTSGPYRFIRHPTYLGVILAAVCTPLLLGSWWALLPGGIMAALFVIRTALEDRMLQEELPGYRAYAARVRYRLLPGIW